MSQAQSGTALDDLVRFLIFLSVVGLLTALFVYFTAVAPAQHAMIVAPMNAPI